MYEAGGGAYAILELGIAFLPTYYVAAVAPGCFESGLCPIIINFIGWEDIGLASDSISSASQRGQLPLRRKDSSA